MGDKQLHWRNTSYILHNGRMISLEEFAIYLWRTGRQGLQDSQHKEIQILKMLMLAILDRPFYIMYMHYITLWRPWIQKKICNLHGEMLPSSASPPLFQSFYTALQQVLMGFSCLYQSFTSILTARMIGAFWSIYFWIPLIFVGYFLLHKCVLLYTC